MASGVLTCDQPIGTILNLQDSNQGQVRVTNSSPSAAGGVGPPPTPGQDGGVALAGIGGASGTLTYLKGDATAEFLAWNGTTWDAEGLSPFRGTWFVDPTFAGKQLGSEVNPFTTIAAAFAAAAIIGSIGGVVELPPGSTITENVTFPLTGEWELRSRARYTPATVSILAGTIDLSTSATARRALSNIQVTGAVSGNAVGSASRLLLTNCILDSTLTLTATGAAFWRVGLAGSVNDGGQVGFAGAISGATSIAGGLYATNFLLSGAVTFSQPSVLSGTNMNPGTLVSNATGSNTLILYDCSFSGGASFTASSGTLAVFIDGASAANLLPENATAGAGVTFRTLRGNGSTRATPAGNFGPVSLGRFPSNQVVINVSFTVLAVGTTAVLQAAVTYTDMTGALVTQNIGGTLNAGAGAAVGDKLSASISFSQNGATAMTVQVTGVTTAGALSYQFDASAQMVS